MSRPAGGRVDALVQRSEPDSSLTEQLDSLHEVDEWSREPNELPHYDGVAFARVIDCLGATGPFSVHAADDVSEDSPTSGALEFVALHVELLVRGRDPRVPDQHVPSDPEATDIGAFRRVDSGIGLWDTGADVSVF
jgi:hypothetical protein